jgi:hypothetical protein
VSVKPRDVCFALSAVIGALVLVLAPAAFAGKPGPSGGKGGGSLSLVVLNSPYGDNLPHYGGQVTFKVSTTATDRPYVNLDCRQNGILVYSNQVGYFPSYPWVQYFGLSSSYWTGGAASCTATLTYSTGRGWSSLATISFTALA